MKTETTTPPLPGDGRKTTQVEATANEFDRMRDCFWNSVFLKRDYNAPEFAASQLPAFESLGDQCHGTPLELALLHTLRPCKDCGGDHLYFSSYQVSCCSCFADQGGCEDCREHKGGECNVAENMNLPDAITRWNIRHGDDGPRGRVTAIG